MPCRCGSNPTNPVEGTQSCLWQVHWKLLEETLPVTGSWGVEAELLEETFPGICYVEVGPIEDSSDSRLFKKVTLSN